MKNKLRADAFSYSLSLALNRVPAFLLLPLAAHQMAPETMGIWVTALMVSDLLQAVCNLGLRPAFFRFFATSSSSEGVLIFSTTLLGTAFGGIMGGALLWAFIWGGGELHFSPLFTGLTANLSLAVALVAWLGGISNTFMLYFKAEQRAVTFLKITIVAFFWEAAFAGALIYFHLLTPMHLLLLEGSKQTFIAIVSGFLCRQKWKFLFDREAFNKLIGYGIWLIPTTFFTSLIFLADRFWLGHLANLKTVGIYGVYYRLTMPLGILFSGYIASLDSQLFKMEKESVKIFLPKTISKFVIWGGCASVAISWVIPFFLNLINSKYNALPASYANGVHYIPLFSLALFAFYFSDHFGSALEFSFQTRRRMVVLSVVAICHFVLVWIGLTFAHEHSWDMGAFAVGITFFSFLALAFWQGLLTQVKVDQKMLGLFFTVCICCLGAAWFFAT